MSYSEGLTAKINSLKSRFEPIKLGRIDFASPLLLAPMASICNYPYRLLLEELGAGGTVSELISAHAIHHGNERTMKMLRLHEKEKNVGIQLFGENADLMAEAAKISQDFGPKFIDINMGCPVRKVVTKGGGSALLKDPAALGPYLRKIKSAISIPLTIKIRMGWDADGINADEIIHVAEEEGIEFVAIHGRTRAQQYTGSANWEYLESLVENSKLPLIGNGDLHNPVKTKNRLEKTKMDALMIARGAIRNPFIFLETYQDDPSAQMFGGSDYLEIIQRLYDLVCEAFDQERVRMIQLRKFIVWFAAGFPNASKFRNFAFTNQDLDELMNTSREYFLSLEQRSKSIDFDQVFMNSGHG